MLRVLLHKLYRQLLPELQRRNHYRLDLQERMRQELYRSLWIGVQQHPRWRMQQRMLRKLQQLLHQRLWLRLCERMSDILRLGLQELMYKRMQQHKQDRVDINLTLAWCIDPF